MHIYQTTTSQSTSPNVLRVTMKSLLLIGLIVALVHAEESQMALTGSDEIQLVYMPKDDGPLYGQPGTETKLVFHLKNNGDSAAFGIEQTSNRGSEMIGEFVRDISAQANTVATILINNLRVPNLPAGTEIELTVTAKRRVSTVSSSLNTVSRTVIFTIGDPLSDNQQPKISIAMSGECKYLKNDTLCANSQWQAEFEVEDETSGLVTLTAKAAGRDSYQHPVTYRHPNFKIGTKDDVILYTEVSCCVGGVTIEATDAQGNQITKDFIYGVNESSGLLISSLLMAFISFKVAYDNL
eukprot:maker-scaffold360_size197209-snap-gene-0.45 protein:Tk00950 transcript:maker-scaffold360_size197209-snap-gene-0.45-mRNA-1 annotation:"hypothetical protein DAPPUDRAFT_306032"